MCFDQQVAFSKKSFSFQQDHVDVKQPIGEGEVKEESSVKDESSSMQSPPRGAQGGIQVDLPQILGKQLFLDAPSHLYMRICPFVRPSVRPQLFSNAH